MDAVHGRTPFELLLENNEAFSYWDIPLTIVSVAATPIKLISHLYSSCKECKKIKKTPPSAHAFTLLGEINQMKSDPMRFLVKYSLKYGKEHGICKLPLGDRVLYIVTNPILAKRLLKDSTSFPRGASLDGWRDFSPGGMADTLETQKSRKQAIHFIGPPNLPTYFSDMTNTSKQWIERLTKKGTFDLFHETAREALATMGKIFFFDESGENPFGLDEKCDVASDKFLRTFKDIMALITRKVTTGESSPEDQEKMRAYKATLKEILAPIFKKDIENPNPPDRTKKKLEIFEIDPKKYDIDDIVEKSFGFLHGSFATSAKTLAWILYLLGKDQTFQDRLIHNVRKEFGDKPPTTLEELKRVPLLFETIEEALRLYAPFPKLARDIENPDEFPGFEVEKGGTIVFSPYLMGHDATLWENPERFNPDRWTEEMLTDAWQLKTPKYLPFLYGQHVCPGRHFMKQNTAIQLVTTLLNGRFVLEDPNIVPKLLFNITLDSETVVYGRLEKVEK